MAKKPEQEFGTATLIIDADNTKMKRVLKESERIATASAQKMEQSTAQMQQRVGAGVTALGQAAAFSSNQFVGLAGQAAALAFTLGPLGILVTALVAGWRLFASAQEKAKEKADAWAE